MDIISSTASAGAGDLRSPARLSLSNQGASFGETDYPLSRSLSAVPSIAEYPLIILFTTIGASFLISSGDLVSMYLSIELQSFAVYILAAIYRNSESATSAGLKYFLLGALSSALILLGSSLIYAYTGLTHFEGIYMISNCNGDVASIPQALLGEGVSSFPNLLGNHSDISPLGETSSVPLSSQCNGEVIDKGIPTFSEQSEGNQRVGATPADAVEQGIVLGVLIIGVGFLFKVAAAPFHN